MADENGGDGLFGSAEADYGWTQGSRAAEASSDVEILRRVWRNEKAAPEILPYEILLIQRIREQILLMEDTLSTFAGTSSDELTLSMYRMDIDRTTFLLRAYLRVRLQKIEQFAMHILRTEELWERLSQQEQDYVQRYIDILQKHMEQSVLSKLPFGYQSMLRQAMSSEEDDMIPEPALDTFVFCKSKGSIPSLQLDEKGDETVDLLSDDLYILRYRPIRRLLETDRIELV
ncbi:hypothetical protein KP509_1Z114700 [Ceratopteris richardii]|nr:hypothetical protein KP509_1Z114700 [Ceratopteris richardii]